MGDLLRSNLTMLGLVCSIGSSFVVLPAEARHAYDSSGSSSQSSSSNPYAVNQFTPPGATGSSTANGSSNATGSSTVTGPTVNRGSGLPTSGSSATSGSSINMTPPSQSVISAPNANPYISPQNQHASPHKQNVFSKVQSILSRNGVLPSQHEYTPQQNPYAAAQNDYALQPNQYSTSPNHYVPQQGPNPYPQQTRNNGTNFYGISPEQISGGAAVHGNTWPSNAGSGRGGYDPRWNPNFGTGAGAQTMARESGGLAQSLRDNFPLPMSGDEAQMFQVNDFAARSNGGMQSRRP
ncbi:MAG TPA: hypothetical protein V6C89_08535 [Drouetiella sp.]